MAKPKPKDPKVETLTRQGCLNPRPDTVADPLFVASDFFDPRDLVQVKYEMVRRVRTDGHSVSAATAAFGFSRPSYYLAQDALGSGGLAALLPKKPGPRGPRKLTAEVVAFLRRQLLDDPALSAADLAERARERFGCKVHPRSVERALSRPEKKHW